MSTFSEIDIDMANLKADVTALQARVKKERELTDYWYERCMVAEQDMIRYAGLLGD